MTNKEIDKLLSILDNKSLEDVKEYLIKEKELNTSKLRQKTFEKYLTTNIFGINQITTPKLYSDSHIQLFTNCASIYIINKNLLNVDTEYLSKEKNRKRTHAHRYQLVSKEEMNASINKVENMLGHYFFDVLTMECGCDGKSKTCDVEYLDELYKKIHSDKFKTEEIDIADILLNNPNYVIYNKTPILKAESEIGKAYILGYKRQ